MASTLATTTATTKMHSLIFAAGVIYCSSSSSSSSINSRLATEPTFWQHGPKKAVSRLSNIGPLSTTHTTPYVHGDGVCHTTHPQADFPWSICPQLEQCRCGRRQGWKYVADKLPKTCGSEWLPSWLSSNQAWKTSQGGCDINGPTRYSIQ